MGRIKLIIYIFIINCLMLKFSSCQFGPDPWDHGNVQIKYNDRNDDIPPDLEIKPRNFNTKSVKIINNGPGSSEWFYKRLLAIITKNGVSKNNDDGTVDVKIQMKFNDKQWRSLDEWIKSSNHLNENNYRLSLGYIEDAIYKPTIMEKIALTWNEYIHYLLQYYKEHIMYTLGGISLLATAWWLWNHISHKQVLILLFVLLYIYEVFISYKEVEQKELEKFIKAINTCKWYFWSSSCDLPPPDILVFFKYMNPMKIALRMFTNIISEPVISISSTMNFIISGLTDDLWFPFNKIVHGIIILMLNVVLIFILVMIVFNYIFNIPFKLGLFGLSLGLGQRKRTSLKDTLMNNNTREQIKSDNSDRLSGENLNALLSLCSRALTSKNLEQNTNLKLKNTGYSNPKGMKRSASTGRLPNNVSEINDRSIEPNLRKRYGIDKSIALSRFYGGGDGR